jgi:CAAX prenyl protease-like protein
MAFIAIQEGAQYLASNGIVGIPDSWTLYLYPVKTIAVALLLIFYRNSYSEIICSDLAKNGRTLFAIITGIIVFILWINMDWPLATIGSSKGFDPTIVSENFTRYIIIGFRIVGASLIVPIMEELFWRSWLLRYIISPDYRSVEIGRFTLSSFLIGTVMFGMEHNLWLAGIMAGAIYSLLLYRTKSLAQCILAHGITNMLLGIYVLNTGKWHFW